MLSFHSTFGHETVRTQIGSGAIVHKIQHCMPATFKNEATAFQPTNVSFLGPELRESAPVRQSFQAAWFNFFRWVHYSCSKYC